MTESPDSKPTEAQNIPQDSALPDWLKSLPDTSRPYAALARWDRPIGIWLLLLPCWMGLAQMRIPLGFQWIDLLWIILFAIGAIAMRGAGVPGMIFRTVKSMPKSQGPRNAPALW